MIIWLVIALLIAALPTVDFLTRGTFRRLALRNIMRRKTEAAIVVLGAMLGTAIITAAFITGDTFGQSIKNIAKTDLGPVDVGVQVVDADDLVATAAVIAGEDLPGTDGMLSVVSVGASVVHPDAPGGQRAEPATGLSEFDVSEAANFGGRPADTGLQGVEPVGAGQAVMVDRIARELQVEAGDTVLAYAYGQELELEVTQVVRTWGVMGSAEIVVAPGTIAELVAAADPTLVEDLRPSGLVLISNEGGVFDGADGSDAVATEVSDRLEASGRNYEVGTWKQELLEEADEAGTELSTLFSGIGSFSVIAGILLLVNLFVMLAEERKSEMGMLRAVGFKRGHLTRSFAIEGLIYAALASVVGAIVGIGVGWGITQASSALLFSDEDTLVLTLAVQPSTLIIGGLVGFVIASVTAWGTSIRISRLNIISAVRDLPNPAKTGRRLFSLIGALAVVALGLFIGFTGYTGDSATPLLAGPSIAMLAAMPVLTRFLPRRPVVLALAAGVLVWCVACFPLFPGPMGNSDIDLFVVMGVVMTAAAVAAVTALDQVWAKVVSLSGGSLGPRLALAYPLNRLFRTGLLLGMFSIVVFTITFISVLDQSFTNQAPSFASDLSAGFDISARSNPNSPLTDDVLEARDDVEDAVTLRRSWGEFSLVKQGEQAGSEDWAINGFGSDFIAHGVPVLTDRGDYGDDRAVFEAVLNDPNKIVVNSWFFGDDGGPDSGSDAEVGDLIRFRDPDTDKVTEFELAGVVSTDFIGFGALVNNEAMTGAVERSVPNRHLVRVADGFDAEVVADDIKGTFVRNGVDSDTFESVAKTETGEQSGFFTLMRGYLALGLLIGVAGLAVVMVRAVRERRRQIGMLRAMGVKSSTVRGAFLAEAGFVALQGIIIGIVLGSVTSYSVVTYSETFGDDDIPFAMPWIPLVLISLVPLAAVLVSTLVPAARAAAIRPAAALRIAD